MFFQKKQLLTDHLLILKHKHIIQTKEICYISTKNPQTAGQGVKNTLPNVFSKKQLLTDHC